MTIHDLKFMETRGRNPDENNLWYWCTCGDFQGHSSYLGRAEPIRDFMLHLRGIDP